MVGEIPIRQQNQIRIPLAIRSHRCEFEWSAPPLVWNVHRRVTAIQALFAHSYKKIHTGTPLSLFSKKEPVGNFLNSLQ